MKINYITTPLYYVNDVPHIGHAYTTIAADVWARWKRLSGEKVFFLTGTDEHGQKIAEAAEKNKEQPQDYVNRIANEFKKLWTTLNITYDDFIQTTEERHKKVAQAVFEKLKKSGDIYKGTYEDWYCLQDESYFTESELVDKKCPNCGRAVQKLKEESYFFKLSKYEKNLLDHYKNNPEFLSPSSRSNEIINFVKSGLRDLSITRTKVKWGIPVSSDPNHVIYVWFEALQNYISALGYDPTKKDSLTSTKPSSWPADVHVMGKEIFRFHTVIWPAMLMALDIPLPKKVFAHGWWTVEGKKMSKSLGNVVDPHKMCSEYGVDAFRYFLLREVPFGSDGDFSEKSLLTRYNAELANNLGNLLQRSVTLVTKNFSGNIPKSSSKSQLLENLPDFVKKIDVGYTHLAFNDVLEQLFGLMLKTNKFIDDKKPWTLGVDQKEDLGFILTECLKVLKLLALLLWPIMPTKTQEMWEKLGEKDPLEKVAGSLIKEYLSGTTPSFATGQKVTKGSPLFMRLGGRWK